MQQAAASRQQQAMGFLQLLKQKYYKSGVRGFIYFFKYPSPLISVIICFYK
jgi:hypothetical protein